MGENIEYMGEIDVWKHGGEQKQETGKAYRKCEIKEAAVPAERQEEAQGQVVRSATDAEEQRWK